MNLSQHHNVKEDLLFSEILDKIKQWSTRIALYKTLNAHGDTWRTPASFWAPTFQEGASNNILPIGTLTSWHLPYIGGWLLGQIPSLDRLKRETVVDRALKIQWAAPNQAGWNLFQITSFFWAFKLSSALWAGLNLDWTHNGQLRWIKTSTN